MNISTNDSSCQAKKSITVDMNNLDMVVNLQTWVILLEFFGIGSQQPQPPTPPFSPKDPKPPAQGIEIVFSYRFTKYPKINTYLKNLSSAATMVVYTIVALWEENWPMTWMHLIDNLIFFSSHRRSTKRHCFCTHRRQCKHQIVGVVPQQGVISTGQSLRHHNAIEHVAGWWQSRHLW